jgi:hypothetical protein
MFTCNPWALLNNSGFKQMRSNCADSEDEEDGIGMSGMSGMKATLGKRKARGELVEEPTGLHACIRKLERSGDCYVVVPPEGETHPENLRYAIFLSNKALSADHLNVAGRNLQTR